MLLHRKAACLASCRLCWLGLAGLAALRVRSQALHSLTRDLLTYASCAMPQIALGAERRMAGTPWSACGSTASIFRRAIRKQCMRYTWVLGATEVFIATGPEATMKPLDGTRWASNYRYFCLGSCMLCTIYCQPSRMHATSLKSMDDLLS